MQFCRALPKWKDLHESVFPNNSLEHGLKCNSTMWKIEHRWTFRQYNTCFCSRRHMLMQPRGRTRAYSWMIYSELMELWGYTTRLLLEANNWRLEKWLRVQRNSRDLWNCGAVQNVGRDMHMEATLSYWFSKTRDMHSKLRRGLFFTPDLWERVSCK
jgi:hypothetical protein